MNGGSPVTDYKLYWSNPATPSAGFVLYVGTTKPNLQYTFTGLTAGLAYSFTVVAVNVVGDSP